MEIRIRAKECCGGICTIDDTEVLNNEELEDCQCHCHEDDSKCHHEEWADD